jgi:ubiquinone/menaquinone biosynthesis C-methylase UbiE
VKKLEANKPNYGNWFSTRELYVLGAVAIFFLMLSLVFLPALAAAAAFLVAFAYFAFARYKFSLQGGNLQAQIREMVLDHFDWDGQGQALDIGCGNGPLAIAVAQKFPKARVTGIDYWGRRWDYSKRACEHNAEIEGVADRVTFQRASASELPFDDESFDAAVSNFVFHAVRDASDKRDIIKESLRVVKKGGTFSFQDFFSKRVYGDVEDLLETIRSWGVSRVEFIDTSGAGFIPVALRPLFVFGMGILYGRK